MTSISLPELCLVALIGASGSGKTTFAREQFAPGEVLSSDAFRMLVSGDENAQDATHDAFEALYFVARQRLRRGLLTVIDATSVQADARRHIVALAREFDVLPVAVVLDLPEDVLMARYRARTDRHFGPQVISGQVGQLRKSLGKLQAEGFRHVTVLRSAEDVRAVSITRTRLYSDLRHEHGPFDFIGDVHGCLTELRELLEQLGYTLDGLEVTPPAGRKAVFLGDLVDRGPDTPGVLRLVMGMVAAGTALCVPGNHDEKLGRALRGEKVTVAHGLDRSLAQLEGEGPEFRQQVADFIRGLVSHYVLDGDEHNRGRVVVAHAGMKEAFQGRASGRVRAFALYGETTGETDEFGLPVRLDWAAGYRGEALVVYGHTPVPQAEWLNRTIDIDTGCVFGGALTALRYPELEVLSVPAREVYSEPVRPLVRPLVRPVNVSAQQQHDTLLDLADVTGARLIETRLRGRIAVREAEAAAALEVLGRYSTDPRWLVYLPPTMSPCETSGRDGFLEYPTEAFEHYRRAGLTHVICEEKHMGSRAVIVLTRSADVAAQRFGVQDGHAGAVYTRTGRPFFEEGDHALASGVLDGLRGAAQVAGLWEALGSEWVILDAEILPWSFKAGPLIREQYAAVGAAAQAALPAEVAVLEAGVDRGLPLADLLARTRQRLALTRAYSDAYRPYVRPVKSPGDLRVAPFHVLASEGAVHTEREHAWHLELLASLARAAPGLVTGTAHRHVELGNPGSVAEAEAWWIALTAAGGEGMVVKPATFTARGRKGLVQPGIKVRGREYLRIIYGPEYTLPEHLDRLRARNLNAKRTLALREFALGVEGLERFVRHEPLRRTHECVFGVLALDSEPLDPRL
ncbi:polynucleotide kinase-phosphatase [Deinococcus aquiradiocola]|uniref:Polynucleotide kinase-phosphatase n=1 Tax=Deinococcus aquiradiocola TaxID=393059 RepID=A0A917UM26_9DEIO|nr:polynucleotide kinase-phosphatase [Deinococcus aquiradiocola]GGJ67931.1 polynucleotide kinase-phosphatase [Deinococcus aquiradiocola]